MAHTAQGGQRGQGAQDHELNILSDPCRHIAPERGLFTPFRPWRTGLLLLSRMPPDAVTPVPDSTLPAVAPHPASVDHQLARLARLPEAPWLHGEVGRRLAEKLQAIRIEPTHWVDWSAWLGASQAEVQARYPQARRWVYEPQPAMAERSRQQWLAQHAAPWWKPWQKQQAPVFSQWPMPDAAWPSDGAGLLWANMTLHGALDLPGLFKAWHRMLGVGGFVMCSGLGPDTGRELRALYQAMGWGLPTIDFIDMHDLGDAMAKAGFSDPVMDMERLTLTWPDAQAMLAELHTWGGNVAHGRHAGLRTPRWKACLEAALNEHLRRPDGRLGLTLELVYGHAIKPEPRASVAPETRVSVDDMRRMVRQKPPGV
ncbi:MAG: hypothetical protein RLZZ182_2424 [Pseudomonadota bacterium]